MINSLIQLVINVKAVSVHKNLQGKMLHLFRE